MSKTKSRADKLSKISMSTALVASTLTIMTPQAEAKQFSDVDEKSSHAQNIYDLAGRGIISGYPDGTFKPNTHVTRGQAAKMIAGALGLKATAEAPQFEDVSSRHQYYAYISALAEAGIVNGDNGRYNPNGLLTRGQMAKIIARAYEVEQEATHSFTDVPKTHEFAPYINALAKLNITTGKTPTTFAMGDFVTRAQISSFIVRAENATAQKRVEGTIEAIAGDQVTVAGQSYAIPEQFAFLKATENNEALQGASIQFVVKNNEIQQVIALSLTEGNVFDAQGATIGTLSVGNTVATIKNASVTVLTQQANTEAVIFENVVAKDVVIEAPIAKVGSTTAVAATDSKLLVNLVQSTFDTLTVKGSQVDVSLDEESIIKDLRIDNASIATLTGQFNNVYVPANIQLNGVGHVQQLISPAQNGELTTVNRALIIESVNVQNVVYTWQQAIEQLGFNKQATPPSSGNTGGSTTPPYEVEKPQNPKPVDPETDTGEEEKPVDPETGTGEEEKPVDPEAGTGEEEKPVDPETGTGEEEKPVDPETGTGEEEKPVDPETGTGEEEKPVDPETDTGEEEKPVDPETDTGEEEKPVDPETDTGEEEKPVDPETGTGEEEKPVDPEAGTGEEEKPVDPETGTGEEEKPVDPEMGTGEEEKPVNPETGTDEEEKPVDPEAGTGEEEKPVDPEEPLQPVEQVFNELPEVSNEQTIEIEGQERTVSAETLVTLQSLKQNIDEQHDVTITLATNADGEVEAKDIVVATNETNAVLNFTGITEDVPYSISGEGNIQIEGLVTQSPVYVAAPGVITFDAQKPLQQVTVYAAQQVNALNASMLIVQGVESIAFDESIVQNALIAGVEEIVGLQVNEEITLETNRSVTVSNTQAQSLTINAPMQVQANAARSLFAAVTKVVINLNTGDIPNVTINREDVVIDKQNSDSPISKINVNASDAEIIVNEVGHMTVANGVSILTLGTVEKPLSAGEVTLHLAQDMIIQGHGSISALTVTAENGAMVEFASSITKTVISGNEYIKQNTPQFTIAPTTALGKYTIVNAPEKAYYVQYTGITTAPEQTDTTTLKAYNQNTGMYVDAETTLIGIYNETGALQGQVSTDPVTRPIIKVLDVDKSNGVLKLNVTTQDTALLQERLKYISLYSHGGSSSNYKVYTEAFYFEDFNSQDLSITSQTNSAHIFKVPLKDVASLANVVVVTNEYVYDTIPTAQKAKRIDVLKDLAQKAKTEGDMDVLRSYLTQVVGIEGKNYDSIFIESIADKLINGDLKTIEEVIAQTEQNNAVTYNKIIPVSELLLGASVTTPDSSGNATATAIVEGSNILVNGKAQGTTIVPFTDVVGDVTLLKLDVAADKTVTHTVLKEEVAANAQLLNSDARLKTDAGKTYILPKTVDVNNIVYTPGTSGAVGIFNSYIVESNNLLKKDITPKSVTKNQLNLTGDVTNKFGAQTGYIVVGDSLYFYPLKAATTEETHVITAGGKSTAVKVSASNYTVADPIVAKTILDVDALKLGQLKTIELTKSDATMHTRLSADTLEIFASKPNDKAMFKVMAEDGKVTLVNATTGADATVISAAAVTVGSSTNVIAPKTSTGDLKEDIIRIQGDTIYATGLGTQRIVKTNGEQADIKVSQVDGQYKVEEIAIATVVVDAATLDLQNVVSVVANEGTSATAQNINNQLISMTATPNVTGMTEFIVTDADGKKSIVSVNVTNGVFDGTDPKYTIAKTTISNADVGMTKISTTSASSVNARAVVKSDTELLVYGTATGTTAFVINGDDNKKALVNITVAKAAGQPYTVTKEVVKHSATSTIANDAQGKSVVRIEGQTLYAIGEGTVDLAIDGSTTDFYRISVVKDDVTGLYKFSTPIVVTKSVFEAKDLGLTVIETATSSNEDIATVEKTTDKITLTTQSGNPAKGLVTVTGPEGTAYVYIEKHATNGFTATVEKSVVLDLSTTGLTNIKEKSWSNADIARTVEVGTSVQFFVLQNGETSYKAVDDAGRVTIVSTPVTTNAAGHREIIPTIVSEVLGSESSDATAIVADTTPANASIVTGDSVRIHGSNVYATKLGKTVVKLSNDKLVEYDVTIDNGIYSIEHKDLTNGVTINDTEIDLDGNLTVVEAPDVAIATLIAKGKQLIVTGQATGTTSAVIQDGTKKVRVVITVATDNTVTVEPLKVELAQDETVTAIHEEKTNARIDNDKNTIYVLETGTFEYISKDASGVESVKQLTIVKNGTAYTVTPSTIASTIYGATDLGLTNTLQIESGYAQGVVRATVVNDRLVLYKVGVGNTDVVVTDGNGQKTVIHVAVTANDFTPTIARKDTPFEAANYSFAADKAIIATVNNTSIANIHADGKLYLFSVGTTYATLVSDDEKALAKITVVKAGNKLEATITPIKKTAAELAIGATTVTALPSDGTTVGTDASIVRVEDNVVYAVGTGTTVVKVNGKIVKLTVASADNAYTITVDDVVNFIELPIGEGTYTVADITGTNAVKVLQDNKGTVADKTDDSLIIYTTATNGNTDLLITTGTGASIQKTLYHIAVSNGVITNSVSQVANTTGGTTITAGADKLELRDNQFYLLKEGNVALTGPSGLVNVQIVRDFTTKQFKATQQVVEYTLKEALTLPVGETSFAINDKVLTAVEESATKTFYTANYRVEASTELVNDQYKLTVAERHFNKVDPSGYGLTLTGTTFHSEDEGIAKAEVATIDGTEQLIVYAGEGTVAGTTNITVTEGTKKLTIKVTRAADGTLTHEIVGTADAVKFADLGLTPTDTSPITVEGYDEAYVQANVTDAGISLSAQATGTTSLLVKQDGETKAIINIRVADGKVIPTVVKYTGALTEVITGDASTTRTDNGEMYAVKEGVVLYANGVEAVQLRITKNTETNLYSITPATFKLTSTMENLDLVPDATTTLTVSNSSIADVYQNNAKLYVVAKSLGYTDVLVTKGADKAVIHVNSKVDGVTAKVATVDGTGYVGNSSIQVRDNKLYSLQVGTSTITKTNASFVNATVTRNATTNEFEVELVEVKKDLGSAVTLVGDATDMLISVGNVIYAKAEGEAQIIVDGKLRNVEVVKNADGTHSIEVADAQEQLVLKAADLGLTLSNTTAIVTTSITGSNSVKAEVIGQEIYVSAIGIGKAELLIDGKTVVYVDVNAENNMPKFKEHHIAKATITDATALTKVDDTATVIRINDKEVYALKEGVELVKDTSASGASLYKVVATRENNKLKVDTPKIIKKSVPGVTATSVPYNTVVRGTDAGELIAVGVGTETFNIGADPNKTTYRVTVSTEGDMTVDVLSATTIDLSNIVTKIDGNVDSSLLAIDKDGTKLNVTAEKEGTELLAIKDDLNTVYVKVVVTKDDSNNYSVAYEIVKTVISASTLGFVPASVTDTVENGIVKVENGEVIVYPGSGNESSYFTIKSAGAEQAIYKLTTSGVTLVEQTPNAEKVVSGYEVAPFSKTLTSTDLGIVPTIVGVDGLAKATVQNGQLQITATNSGTSYIVIKGENDTYKVVDVTVNTSTWEITTTVRDVLKLDAITQEVHGPVKAMTDASKNISILYATAASTDENANAGKFAYENKGFLYNSNVKNTSGVYSFESSTKVAITNVDSTETLTLLGSGPSVIDVTEHVATKKGIANYKSVKDGVVTYKEIEVKVDANQYKATATNLEHVSLPSPAISAEIIKAPATIQLDGTTVYGNAEKDDLIIVSTKDPDGKVTVYKAVVDANGTYAFEAVEKLDKDATDWKLNAATISVSNSAVARVANNKVYFVGAGETSITFISPTGMERTIDYKVDTDYTVTEVSDAGNVIEYMEERFEVGGEEQVTFTFNMNVPTNMEEGSFLIGSYATAGNGVEQVNEMKFRIMKPASDQSISGIQVMVPEYDSIDYNFLLVFEGNGAKFIQDTDADSPIFKMIKATN